MASRSIRQIFALTALLCANVCLADTIQLGGSELESITLDKQALYPEGLAFNPRNGRFLVGSFREGAVYEVAPNGKLKILINDARLNSILGIRVDVKRDRLIVANSDIGASIRPYVQGPLKLASVGVYSLSSGELIHFVNLGALKPDEKHLANDIAVDPDGNAYITDSLASVIYKVDTQGKPSVFLQSRKFTGKGIGLNGIVYHPGGYLIVAKKNDGVLFKIPVSNPELFKEIRLPRKLHAADGLILVSDTRLVVVTNRVNGIVSDTVFALESSDRWDSACITGKYALGDVYPTTGVVRDGKIYVLHSKLNVLIQAPKSEKRTLAEKAVIQQVGHIEP